MIVHDFFIFIGLKYFFKMIRLAFWREREGCISFYAFSLNRRFLEGFRMCALLLGLCRESNIMEDLFPTTCVMLHICVIIHIISMLLYVTWMILYFLLHFILINLLFSRYLWLLELSFMEFMITSSKFISLFIKSSLKMINFNIHVLVMNTFYLYKFIPCRYKFITFI